MSNYTVTKIENDGRQWFRVESSDGESFEVAITDEGKLIDSDGAPMDYHPQTVPILLKCAELKNQEIANQRG